MVLGFVSFLCHNGWESNLFLVMSRNSVIEVFMLCTFFNLYIHTNVHCANKVLYQRKKKRKRHKTQAYIQIVHLLGIVVKRIKHDRNIKAYKSVFNIIAYINIFTWTS